ncbi:complement component C1q receptor-like [Heterodontus francisci]|uniref:complement component C1q receptor-like n=1 Tax=Heterodontus francisci TaxID=7792 RepID=UPI00355C1A34
MQILSAKSIMLRSVFILLWLQDYLLKSGVQCHATTQRFCNGGLCYSLHWDGGSFLHAKKLCEDKKGILTTMKSQAEAENIRQLLATNVKVTPQLHHLWIGLRRKTKQCYFAEKPLRGFFWVNGNDHSTYSSWIQEPQPTCTHERCVQLQVNFTNQIQLKWKTSSCGKEKDGFICKYEMCESLNPEVGKVVYKTPHQSESSFFSGVPGGSVAIISCINGKSIALKCELQIGEMKWSSSRNLESLCNSCWEKTNDGSCRNGCFPSHEDFFCYCDKGFLVDLQQSKCVPEGALDRGFNESSRSRHKGSESMAANISSFLVATSATKTPTTHFLQPAENSTVTFSPTFRGSEQSRQEAHSNASFLIYQIVIGILVLMLLIAIAVIIIRERGKRDIQKKAPSEHRLATKNTDSVHQVNENAAERTGNVANANHYVETPSACESEVNAPRENGEISECIAH